jgi:outer membrane protein
MQAEKPGRTFAVRALAVVLALILLPVQGKAQAPVNTFSGASGAEGDIQRLTLDRVVQLAIDGNRDLARARLTLREAEGVVSEAWGSIYPRVDLNTSYSRNLSPAVSFLPAFIFDPSAPEDELVRVQFGAENVWSSSITLEQPLFEARAFIGVGAAGRFQAFQEEGVRATLHEVVTQVRVLYYQLLLAQEQAHLIERSVERVVQSLEETRALNAAGLASDYDVLRLEVELANLEPQLRRAANEQRRMERDLVTALDLPPGTVVELEGALAGMDLTAGGENGPENRRILDFVGVDLPAVISDSEVDDLHRRARITNASVRQAGLNQELRDAELQVERSEYLPRVSLFGSYDIQAQQDGSPNFFGESGQRGYGRNVGIRVTIPLFTGFQRGARVEQQRANVNAARVEREMAENLVENEVITLLELADEARLRATSQALAVTQARRGFEIASAQYREGLGSQLELTDAEVALRQSEFNYAEAVFDYLSARARLDQAVGDVPLPGGSF